LNAASPCIDGNRDRAMQHNPFRALRETEGTAMKTVSFNCGWYLPRSARRVITLAGVIIVVVLPAAFASGHGRAALITLGAALLTAAVTEGVRAVLRFRPGTA